MRSLLALSLLFAFGSSLFAAAPPNIVLILADDLGPGDLGCYGQTKIKTPNLDRVAREGVKFQHAFTSNPKCSPCRATILTGRNSWQL